VKRDSISVAVIGAGFAGRAHAAGYRSATTVYGTDHPQVRLVAIADTNTDLAEDVRKRYGYERIESDWRAIAEADDIDAVSVVVANRLHREMAEGLLATGKHVLCEKPLAPSVKDAKAMVAAADAAPGLVASVGYCYRRCPAIGAIREELNSGHLGTPLHFNGHFWIDYALNPEAPFTWRDRGGPGSGALADVGSHLVDLAEYVCGPLTEVSGARHATAITQRPIPAAAPVGHTHGELTGEYAPVENEDVATFTSRFANGALGTFSVSRVAHALPVGLGFEIFCTKGSAAFDFHRSGEFVISDLAPREGINGHRRVIVGPEHPYIQDGLPMDSPGVGLGASDLFVFQARSFLDQVSGIGQLPPCPSFRDGLRGLEIGEAIIASANADGAAVTLA
jgi:predicted dehydrogenase